MELALGHGAPQMNPETKQMSKCDFASTQLKGEQPVCVATCPLGAIQFGPIDELRQRYGELADVRGCQTHRLPIPLSDPPTSWGWSHSKLTRRSQMNEWPLLLFTFLMQTSIGLSVMLALLRKIISGFTS